MSWSSGCPGRRDVLIAGDMSVLQHPCHCYKVPCSIICEQNDSQKFTNMSSPVCKSIDQDRWCMFKPSSWQTPKMNEKVRWEVTVLYTILLVSALVLIVTITSITQCHRRMARIRQSQLEEDPETQWIDTDDREKSSSTPILKTSSTWGRTRLVEGRPAQAQKRVRFAYTGRLGEFCDMMKRRQRFLYKMYGTVV